MARRVNYAATARGAPPVFFLVFPTGTHQLATCFGVPTLVALSLVSVRRLLARPGERGGYVVDSVSDPDDDPDTENPIHLPRVLPQRSPENPLWQEPGDPDSTEKVGLYAIVTFQYSSTILSQVSYHIQYLFF